MSKRDNQQPPIDDKTKEAGLGCSNVQDFRQIHSTQRAPPLPHELTAEWTVNAKLKFARAGETVEKKFSAPDTINPVRVVYKWTTVDENLKSSGQPQQSEEGTPTQKRQKNIKIQEEGGGGGSFHSTTSSYNWGGDVGGGVDSAFSSSNNSNKQQQQNISSSGVNKLETNFYGTRCQSTCNIIVTAVADFLSPSDIQTLDNTADQRNRVNDADSFVFNTTANYTVQPEKSSCSEENRFLNLRDAICQTSDIETNRAVPCERKRSPLQRRDSRKSYNYRRTTADELIQKTGFRSCVDEENSFVPSQIPSTIQTSKSSSTLHPTPYVNLGDNSFPTFVAAEKPTHSDSQKKPRTVHIDVYCTGSEDDDDDDQADAELSSDSDKNDNILDQESNSTFQTVLDNEQMRLRHQRKTGTTLPRRLVDNNAEKVSTAEVVSDDSKNINIGHALTKSSTAEEIQESKQLLFRKHVGDQRAVKLQNLRQKYLRQSSDDTLSFGYPNSSRSTVRDNTCSSISSLMAGPVVSETSCKESGEFDDLSYSLNKSESFEYENAADRFRIRQMERLWSRSLSNEEERKPQIGFSKRSPKTSEVIQEEENLTTQLEIVSETDQSSYNSIDTNFPAADDTVDNKFQQTSHLSLKKPGFLQFFGPHLEHSYPIEERKYVNVKPHDSSLLFPNYEPNVQRWKSETRENFSPSDNFCKQASPQPSNFDTNFQRSGSEAPIARTSKVSTPTPVRRLDMYNRPSPAVSEASSQPPPFGYSSEYLDKAKVFGKVVAARKPGHHVGPTKNPNCSCESCQRWLAERFQIRSRIFSLGEMPILKRPV